MNSEGLRAFMRLGFLLVVLSVLTLFLVKPGTAEFIVTILSIVIGLILIVLVALVNRFIS